MAQLAPIDLGTATNNSNHDDPQHSTKDDDESNASTNAAPISLAQRAPPDFIPTRIWRLYLALGPLSWDYTLLLNQKTQCVRSQRENRTWKLEFTYSPKDPIIPGIGSTKKSSSMGFPYPKTFHTAAAKHEPGMRTRAQEEQSLWMSAPAGLSLGLPTVNVNLSRSKEKSSDINTTINEDPSGTVVHQLVKSQKEMGLTCRWFGITRTRVKEFEVTLQPTYVVLGIFRRGLSSPQERVVFIHKPEHLFRELHWAAYRLRGLRGTFFSLTHVRGFRVYKCDAEKGTHERVELDSHGVADLQLLLHMYNKWYVSGSTAQIWADWIHQSLNNRSNIVPKGTYALELVLGWSMARISIVVLLPVLLSLAIGIYLNSQNWTDLATIQTAWGTASYVVTTGSLLVALLAILSGIEFE
ncbi:hypothetical protein F5Y09DRAFT_300547 [Xylaria sp. FL1042]|nr:hypothetical protein F5Y09DRAFT_300547 [Xylaria sp. FL1042]